MAHTDTCDEQSRCAVATHLEPTGVSTVILGRSESIGSGGVSIFGETQIAVSVGMGLPVGYESTCFV